MFPKNDVFLDSPTDFLIASSVKKFFLVYQCGLTFGCYFLHVGDNKAIYLQVEEVDNWGTQDLSDRR